MGRPPSSNSKRNRQRRAEYQQERLHEKIVAFEELNDTVLPKLAKLLAAGADSATMRKEMAPYMTARQLSIALTTKDEGKALNAISDALNRVEGKPKERVETEHKFSRLKDEELDSILESRLRESDTPAALEQDDEPLQ